MSLQQLQREHITLCHSFTLGPSSRVTTLRFLPHNAIYELHRDTMPCGSRFKGESKVRLLHLLHAGCICACILHCTARFARKLTIVQCFVATAHRKRCLVQLRCPQLRCPDKRSFTAHGQQACTCIHHTLF